MTEHDAWPDLRHPDAAATLTTLQLWMQIVGKIRTAATPWLNHSWHVPLYVHAYGLGTGLIPHGGRAFQIDLDLRSHRLTLMPTDGEGLTLALGPMSVAAFHQHVVGMLEATGLRVAFHDRPNEMPDATPFRDDDAPRPYDADFVTSLWRALVQAHLVLSEFRTGFLGKASPVHLFWGAMDLAVTRFSGRPAPRHPGGLPNLPDAITHEAYSHEVSSAGFWPGNADADALFYSYAYPEPAGFRDGAVRPAAARYDERLGEFVLPYEAVRTADDPRATLLAFLQSTYERAAERGGWDRAALECALGEPGRPRPLG